jgi:hypothetical protein
MTPSCSKAYLLRQIEHMFVSVPEDAYDHAQPRCWTSWREQGGYGRVLYENPFMQQRVAQLLVAPLHLHLLASSLAVFKDEKAASAMKPKPQIPTKTVKIHEWIAPSRPSSLMYWRIAE